MTIPPHIHDVPDRSNPPLRLDYFPLNPHDSMLVERPDLGDLFRWDDTRGVWRTGVQTWALFSLEGTAPAAAFMKRSTGIVCSNSNGYKYPWNAVVIASEFWAANSPTATTATIASYTDATGTEDNDTSLIVASARKQALTALDVRCAAGNNLTVEVTANIGGNDIEAALAVCRTAT